MRTLLLAFGLFFVIALPAFADKGFSTDFESDSVALPFPKGLQMEFDRLPVCGAMINGDLEVGLVGPSGCSIHAPGTPIMYRTFSAERVREFVGHAITTMNNQSSNPLGRTNASGAFETALQDVIAAAFKSEALDWTDASCAGGQPAPGTCGTDDPIQCCQMDPGNGSGSGSGSGSSGGASGGFEPQVASGAVGGDPRNNNGGLAGGDGLPGGSSGGASGGGSGEQYVNRAFELISVKSDDQYSFFFVDTEDKGRATPNNPFGFCTPDSSESAVEGATFTLGSLKSESAEKCPYGHSWTPYGEFMSNMAMAGLAVSAPAWIPIVLSNPVIPAVLVGGAVVAVGGYFVYKWLTSDSPRELITIVTVSCQNLCVVAEAARAVAIEVFVDTIIRLTRDISDQVRRQLDEAIDRFGDLKGEACCATLCTTLRMLITGGTGCGAEGCYSHCYRACAAIANGYANIWNMNCQCTAPGMGLGYVCGPFS